MTGTTPPLPTPLAAVEAMARAMHDRCHPSRNWDRSAEGHRQDWRHDAQSALPALCALYPGLAAVIEGSAVVVPREAVWPITKAMAESRAIDDEGMFDSLGDLIGFGGENKTHTVLAEAYRRALAASPYAPPAPGAEEKSA